MTPRSLRYMRQITHKMIKAVGFVLIFILAAIGVKCDGDFKSAPTVVKVLENDTVILPCYLNTASSEDISNLKDIKWYHESNLVAEMRNESVEIFRISSRHNVWENGTLEIVNIKRYDSGNYTCEINRPDPWLPVKQIHEIEVLQPPSVEPDPLSGHLQVKLGEEVRMSCKPDGVPYPSITWKHDGKDLQLLDNREMLKFVASERNLAGEYECTAINGFGQPASAKIFLNIVYPPVLMTSKSWIHTGIGHGHFAQLECMVSANPSALVTWYKGEIPIPLDKRVFTKVEDEKHTLYIKNVQKIDFGVYTCCAENSLGRGELHIQVSGSPKPAVFKKIRQLDPKNSYTFVWQVDSYAPVIEYNLSFRESNERSSSDWTKLTIPAEHSTGSVFTKDYTLRGLKENTAYEAVVMSRNKFGWSKPSPVLRFATQEGDLVEHVTRVHIGNEMDEERERPEFDYVFNGVSGISFGYIVLVPIVFEMFL